MVQKHKISEMLLLIDDFNISKSILGCIIDYFPGQHLYKVEWYNRNGYIDSYRYREDEIDYFKDWVKSYLEEVSN